MFLRLIFGFDGPSWVAEHNLVNLVKNHKTHDSDWDKLWSFSITTLKSLLDLYV